MIRVILLSSTIIMFMIVIACSGDGNIKTKKISSREKEYYDSPGIGPVKNLKIDEFINPAFSMEGEEIFNSKCITCHQLTEERGIGPGLKGITKRRRPEWIMNQILNPIEMTQKDSLSKELFNIYLSQMTDMDLTVDQARSVLEYFRDLDRR